jgi:DinB family protein
MKAFVEDFRATINTSAVRLLQLTDEESQFPRANGKWSPKQIIGHLIDSAAHNHQRFVRAQLTDELVFPGYEQEEWVRVQRYSEACWVELVTLWKHYNLHLAHLMSHVAEQALTKPRTKHNLNKIAWQSVDETEAVTLEYFMRDYVEHLKHHLRQILGY